MDENYTCIGEGGNPTAFQCPASPYPGQSGRGLLILPVSSKKGMQENTSLDQLYLHHKE